MIGEETRKCLGSPTFPVARLKDASDQDREFSHLALRSVMPGGRLTFSLFLKAFRPQGQQVQYLPFGEAGEIFQAEWLTPLKERGIDRLYFRRTDLDLAIAYLNNHLFCLEAEDPTAGSLKMMVLYDHLNFTLQRTFNETTLTGETVRPALDQVDQVLKALKDENFPLHNLWEALCTEYSLYNHAANVFLMGVGFLHMLKKSPADCRALGIAALFHDAGLLKVPPEVLLKKEPLPEDERQLVQRHPELGYEMLKNCGLIPLESLRLVLEHHEDADGSGYPRGLPLWRQHPHTAILRLVDSYDALTSHRPFRPAQSAYQALEVLRTQKGSQGLLYDQGVLKSFIKFLGLPN